MLADLVRKQEIDILFLQEVTSPIPNTISGYNIGTNGRVTAYLTRDHMKLRDILRLPSGRGWRQTYRVCGW